MGLDYTQGCVNFRDVGEFVNTILSKTLVLSTCARIAANYTRPHSAGWNPSQEDEGRSLQLEDV